MTIKSFIIFVIGFLIFLFICVILTPRNIPNNIPNTIQNTNTNITDYRDYVIDKPIYHPPYFFNYHFQNQFPNYKKQQIIQAFQEITNVTNNQMIFREVNDSSGDIVFKYVKYTEADNNAYANEDDFILGGKADMLGKSYYPYRNNGVADVEITSNWIIAEECEYPQTELHEILHTLGLNHSKESGLMYFYSGRFNCMELKDDDRTLNELKAEWGLK